MDQLIAQLVTAGPVGVFAAYLVWERRADRAERIVVDRERIDADKALAASLATLAATIQQISR